MIKPRSEMDESRSIEIDLTGPDGNAFMLLGKAKKIAQQLSYEKEDIDALMKEMQSSDYENLVDVFEREFGDFVVLYR